MVKMVFIKSIFLKIKALLLFVKYRILYNPAQHAREFGVNI